MRSFPAGTRFDLHLHTTFSDGIFEPAQVLARCASRGLDVLALTDHDVPPQIPAGRHQIGQREVLVIHGVEVSAVWEGRELHLLVYFPEQMPDSFVAFCRRRAQHRVLRYEEARRKIGLDWLEPADTEAREGRRSLTRVHLAKQLVEGGAATSIDDAFRRWLGRDCVPLVDLGWADAIAVAREAGGLTSWAHPDLEEARSWMGTFKKLGLQGVEAARPGYGRGQRKTLRKLAERHELVITGGSDWHGRGDVGRFALPMREAQGFVRALWSDSGPG